MHRNKHKHYTHLKKQQKKRTRDYFCRMKLYNVHLKAKNEFISCKWLGRLFHIIPLHHTQTISYKIQSMVAEGIRSKPLCSPRVYGKFLTQILYTDRIRIKSFHKFCLPQQKQVKVHNVCASLLVLSVSYHTQVCTKWG